MVNVANRLADYLEATANFGREQKVVSKR